MFVKKKNDIWGGMQVRMGVIFQAYGLLVTVAK